MAKDPDFAPSKIGIPDPKSSMEKVVTVCEEKLLNILGEWTVAPAKEDLQKKLKEIMWMNTVIYTIGGWAGRNQGKDEHHEFNADFLL